MSTEQSRRNFHYSLLLLSTFIAISRAGHLYGGDMLLTPEQQATLEATSNPNDPYSVQHAVVRSKRSIWPGGTVPYVLDGSLTRQAVSAIEAAIEEYTSRTCVRFVPHTSEIDYVRFFHGDGCFSYIGRIGGPQDISIGTGCGTKGTVMHEMFHALGRWHEQSRPDRNLHVRIITENIRSGLESNFEIIHSAFVTTQGVPYDLRSIMHYPARAFSNNGNPTILPLNASVDLSEIGQRNGFTASDLSHITTLYCSEGTGSWSLWSDFSSCSRSCNGGVQTRTRMCVRGNDCEGSNVQVQRCNTNNCPIPATWSSWTSWSECSASCGGGRQRRIRSCQGGNTCVGISSQFRDCSTQTCPQGMVWGPWGSWSSCSSTCQGGVRQRRRTCQNGNLCNGTDVQVENCNTNILCVTQPNGRSGEWSSWSNCTVECGGGIRFRTKLCGNTDCDTEQEDCNEQECRPEPTLRGIVHHGCWYMDSRGRLGTLEGRNPDLTDDPLTRENPVSKCGLAAQTESFLFFGVTQGYCISGSNRLSDYQYVRSGLCMDGKGGYSRGYFIMDVYEITSQQNFRDSVVVNDTAITESDVLSTTAQDSSSSSSTGSTSPLETTSGAVILGAQTQHRHLCLLLVILSLCILTALSAWDQ